MAKSSGKSAAKKSGKDADDDRKVAGKTAPKAAGKKSSTKADGKKSAGKKSSTKVDGKNSAGKKADTKAAGKKADSKKADSKKADSKKSGGPTAKPTKNTPEIPSTLERSPDPKAARTYVETHDSAVEQYGKGERASRTALAAVKHSYEKVGDHWEPKDEKGPSDSQAASPRGRSGTSAGGVDATATRAHLYLLAQRLDVPGRSRMTKDQLVEALQKANDAASAKARR